MLKRFLFNALVFSALLILLVTAAQVLASSG